MSRNKGTFNVVTNLEPLIKAPYDARTKVQNYSDLTDPSTWIDNDGNNWLYKGLLVSVESDNGLYMLLDQNNYNLNSNWIRFNTTADTSINLTGTYSPTFQLNNNANGVIIEDDNGHLRVVTYDGSTLANIEAGFINASSLKLDSLNGSLYASDGSIYAVSSDFPLKAFQGYLYGNDITSAFTIDHSLNTLKQNITIFDENDNVIYPEIERGLYSDVISFVKPIPTGITYDVIILGF